MATRARSGDGRRAARGAKAATIRGAEERTATAQSGGRKKRCRVGPAESESQFPRGGIPILSIFGREKDHVRG